MPRWLRVVVGAFVLSAWLTVAVSCRRRQRRRSAIDRWRIVLPGRTRTARSQAWTHPERRSPDSPRRPGGLYQRQRDIEDSSSQGSHAPSRRGERGRHRQPRRQRRIVAEKCGFEGGRGPCRQAPALSAKPKLWQLPHALHNDRRVESTAAAVTPVTASKPTTAAPQRPAVTLRAVPSAQTPDLKPVAANISPATADSPSTSAAYRRDRRPAARQAGHRADIRRRSGRGIGGVHRRRHLRTGFRPQRLCRCALRACHGFGEHGRGCEQGADRCAARCGQSGPVSP